MGSNGKCDYVDAIPLTGKIRPEVPRGQSHYRNAPYNLFVNDLLREVDDGYIIVLDDDDEFLTADSITKLEPSLHPDNLVISRFALGEHVLPRYWEEPLQINDVPCSSIIYHSKHKKHGLWHEKYSGDFFAASNLQARLNSVWLDEVIAGTQERPGLGRAKDAQYMPWGPRKVKIPVGHGDLLSIVIPVMNQAEYTRAILDNIEATTDVKHEVIVIDNGSTDATADLLKAHDVSVIRNNRNRGISRSWNQGARAAKGDYIAFLNNDLLLPEGWASALLAQREHAICPAYKQGTRTVPNFISRNKSLRARPPRTRIAKTPGTFPQGFAGFCFILSREAYETTGPFDELYFYWFGDNDYYIRLGEMGFRCVQLMNVEIHHFGSQTLMTCGDFERVKARELKLYKSRWPDG